MTSEIEFKIGDCVGEDQIDRAAEALDKSSALRDGVTLCYLFLLFEALECAPTTPDTEKALEYAKEVAVGLYYMSSNFDDSNVDPRDVEDSIESDFGIAAIALLKEVQQ